MKVTKVPAQVPGSAKVRKESKPAAVPAPPRKSHGVVKGPALPAPPPKMLVSPMVPTVVSDPKGVEHSRSFDDGSYYDGPFANNEFDGEGTYYWADRVNWMGEPFCLYTGAWKAGCMHGFGCEVSEEGTYVGEYISDKRHGKGLFLYKDGSYYVGQWDDDQPSTGAVVAGKNLTINSSGQVLQGVHAVSSPDGTHTLEFHSGCYYNGGVDKEGREHGFGVFSWNVRNWQSWPRTLYVGDWAHGTMEGEGFYTGKAGTYFGGYLAGRRHGAGVFFYNDGGFYVGTFVEFGEAYSRPHGISFFSVCCLQQSLIYLRSEV